MTFLGLTSAADAEALRKERDELKRKVAVLTEDTTRLRALVAANEDARHRLELSILLNGLGGRRFIA